MFDEIKEYTQRYIKSLAMDLVVVLVAVAYIFYQMVTLEVNAINPLILIAEAFMGIVCGIVIKQALGENGFSKGYNSEKWAEEEQKYNEACTVANPYMDRTDNYYLEEEIEKRRNYRRQHLLSVRLRYEDWFDNLGVYIGKQEEYDKLKFKQKLVLNKCVRVKIYVLNLFSEYSKATEEYTHKEKTDKNKKATNLTKNTVSAVLIAIIGVYFVPLFNKWSWASFISATFQVSMWVLFGVLQLYDNFNFVVQTKVAILRTKKENIKKFTSGCEKGLYKTNPYDPQPVIEEEKKEIPEVFFTPMVAPVQESEVVNEQQQL